LSKSDKEYLKVQLAVAIFKSAESGDRGLPPSGGPGRI